MKKNLLLWLMLIMLSISGMAQENVTIGEGNASSYSFSPTNLWYNNSVSQQIYTADEIGVDAGQITAVSFMNTVASTTRDIVLLMGETTLESFSSASDALGLSELTEVYSGQWQITANEWSAINLTTPYDYTGGNLVIVMLDNTGSYVGSSKYWRATSVSGKVLYKCSDTDGNYDLSVAISYSTASSRPDVQLTITPVENICHPISSLTATEITHHSAGFSWSAPEDGGSYIVQWKKLSDEWDGDNVQSTTTSSTSVEIGDLLANTQYSVRIANDCGGGDYSAWRTRTFKTACSVISEFPMIENFDTYGTGSSAFPDCWSRRCSGTSSPNSYIYINSTQNQTSPASLYMYAYSSTGYLYAIMPAMSEDVNVSALTAKFKYNPGSASYSMLSVGVISHPDSLSTYTEVQAINPPSSGWREAEVNFSNYTGSGKYIAFRFASGYQSSYTSYNVFIDNLIVAETPLCGQPQHAKVADYRQDYVTLSWDGDEGVSQWRVEYGEKGFAPGEGAETFADDTTVIIGGLETATEYDFYVYSVCEDGTYSFPSDVVKCTTLCEPLVEIPYTMNFDSLGTATYPECWRKINTNNSTYPIKTTTNYSAGSSLNFQGTSSTYDVAILPELDGNIDFGDIMLSFMYRNGSSTTQMQVGVMENPADLSTFVPVADITKYTGSDWDLQDVTFENYEGDGRFIAFRHQGSTSVYVDDVILDHTPSCSPVKNLTVSNISGTAALVSWEAGSQGTPYSYTVEYAVADSDDWQTVSTEDDHYFIDGLQENTNYKVRVAAECGETSEYKETTFATIVDACDVQVGSGTSTTYYFPVNNYYKYSYTQQIYLASEIGTAGPISGIAFNYRGSSMTKKTNVKIYLKHTDQSSFSLASDRIPFDGATLVYSGPLNCTQGWNSFSFTSPFVYNGTDNLVIMVCDSSNAYDGSSYTFDASSVSPNRSLYFASDNTYQDPNSPSASGYISSSRNNVKFLLECTCPRTSVVVTGVTAHEAEVVWASQEATQWLVEHRTATGDWISDGVRTENSITLEDLEYATSYIVRVAPICDGDTAMFSSAMFTTECDAMEIPYTENFDSYTSTGSGTQPKCWTRAGNYSVSNPYIANSSSTSTSPSNSLYFSANDSQFSGICMPSTGEQAVSELRAKFKWYATNITTNYLVVGVMENPEVFTSFVPVDTIVPAAASTWADVEVAFDQYDGEGTYIAFRFHGGSAGYMDDLTVEVLPTCDYVKNLSITDVMGTSAYASWDHSDPESVGSYTVQFAPAGTEDWQTLTVAADQNGTFLTGLEQNTSYTVSVTVNCSNGETSEVRTADFMTVCAAGGEIEIAEATNSSYHYPVNNFYNFSFTEQIFLADEMVGESEINGVAFSYKHTSPTTKKNNVKLYIGHTEKSSFESTSDFIPLTDLTLVYSGALNCSHGWNNFMFDEPFQYDGESNLVLVAVDSSAAYNGSAFTFNVHTVSTDRSLAYYSDSKFPNPENLSTYDGEKLLAKNMSDIKFLCECDETTTCFRPNVVVTNIGSYEADVEWVAGGSESQWEIQIRNTIDNEWTDGETVSVTFVHFDNLYANVHYDVRVRSICGSGDYSDWTIISFITGCGDITLPYTEHFDSYTVTAGALPKCWTRGSSYSASVPQLSTSYRKSSPNSLSFTASSTKHATVALMPVADIVEMNNIRIRFDFYMTSIVGNKLEIGVVDAPEDTASFQSVITVINDSASVWKSKMLSLSGYEGDGRCIAFRYTGSGTGYMDNLVVEQNPDCDVVYNISVSNIAGSSALVSWDDSFNDVETYTVEVAEFETEDWNSFTASANYYMVSGLSGNTKYTVRVRPNCSTGEAAWKSITFTTKCDAGGDVTVGTGNTATYLVPVNNNYKYTHSQQIYLASEIEGASEISAISFRYAYSSSMSYKTKVKIYLGHTANSSFATTDFLSLDDMQLVYSGNLNCSQGWNKFDFSTPFSYNGTDNIVLAVVDSSNNYNSSSYTFLSTPANNMVLYSYTDSGVLSYTTGSRGTNRSNVIFHSECDETVSCVVPNVVVGDIDVNSANLFWAANSSANSFEVEIRNAGDSTWTELGTTGNTEFALENLNTNTSYEARVRANCGGGDYSYWKTLSFRTDCGTFAIPYDEDFDSYGVNSSTNNSYPFPACWVRQSTASATSPYITSTYVSSPGSLYFSAGTSTHSTAVFGPIDENYNLNQLMVKLSFRTSSINSNVSKMVIGAVTDPLDASTFTPIYTVTASAPYIWQDMEAQLSGYEGDARYIALRYTGSENAYIDDLHIMEIPSCMYPNNVVASNPTSSSVTLAWNERGSAENWVIEYGPAGFEHGTGETVDADSNPFTVEGLEANTQYDFYVKSNCGGDNESQWSFSKGTIWTQCLPIEELPYTEKFDSYGTGSDAYPNCWTRIGSTGTTTYPYCSSSYSASSPASLALYNSSSSSPIYFAANEISEDIDVSALAVTFKYRPYSTYLTSCMLVVGVMTNPGVASTFEPVDTITPATSAVWSEFEVLFNNYTGSGKYIAFKYSSSQNTSYLDDVVIDLAPTCLRPSNLVASQPTANSVNLSWTENGTATGWNIEYGPAGFAKGSGTVVSADSNPFEVEDLEPNTAYDFYIQSVCDGGDTSSWAFGKVTMTTECVAITELPQTWDLESNNTGGTSSYKLPACWKRVGSTSYPYIYSYYANSGSNSLYFSSTGNTAVLPAVDTDELPIDTIQISFYARTYSSSNIPIVVGVMTDPAEASTFAPVETVYVNGTHVQYDVSFSGFTGQGSYIALKSGSSTSIYVDDITLDYIPACPKVKNMSVSDVTENSATVTWTGNSSDGYKVRYRAVGAANWQNTTTPTESVTLNGLTSLTTYEVGVAPVCGGEEIAFVATTFQTTMVPVSLPYTTDFSTSDWKFVNGNATNKWKIGTPTGYAEGALYITDDDMSAQYATGNYSVVVAEKTFNMTGADSVHIEFDVQVGGEVFSSGTPYDFMKAFLAPGATEYGSASTSSYTPESSASYLTNALDFSAYASQSGIVNNSYIFAKTGDNTVHISMNVANPAPNGVAKMAFLWRNDGSSGTQPGAVISNFSISADGAVVDECDVPTALAVNGQTQTSATATWNAGDASAWKLQYKLASATAWGSEISVNTASYQMTGLTANTQYQVRVKAVCGAGNESDWTSAVSFTTLADDQEPCNAPTNVTISDVAAESFVVTWNANGASKWNVRYRVQNAATWISATVETTPSYTVTGLQPETAYEVQIQAVCDGTTSEWSASATATTTTGLSELSKNIILYPNPATNFIDVRVSDNDVTVSRLEVYDVYGKLISEVEVVENPTRINVSTLAGGMYFVKVVTGNGTVTKSFIRK